MVGSFFTKKRSAKIKTEPAAATHSLARPLGGGISRKWHFSRRRKIRAKKCLSRRPVSGWRHAGSVPLPESEGTAIVHFFMSPCNLRGNREEPFPPFPLIFSSFLSSFFSGPHRELLQETELLPAVSGDSVDLSFENRVFEFIEMFSLTSGMIK